MKGGGKSAQARIRARRNAVQALYQWLVTGEPMAQVSTDFEADRLELKNADIDYFRELVGGVARTHAELEMELSVNLDRDIARLDTVERAILLLAIFELKHHVEIPWRVVLNEAIELAKMFGAEQSHTYINAVLEAAAKRVRSAEMRSVS